MTYIKPKKSLGQNFLIDETVVERIIAAADLQSADVVLEIGPGQGVLTEALAEKCRQVVAVEIDQSLVTFLQNKFRKNHKIKIIQGDILHGNINEIISGLDLPVTSYKVIANLPYYITSPIIRLLLENEFPSSEMILMVQKEVAERIIAKPGELSILGISVQYYAQAEILFFVPRTAFDPVPEVESAIIRLVPYKDGKVDQAQREQFFRLVRAGFCAKRKTLANNLANSFHLTRSEIEVKISTVGLNQNVRAQELSLEDWQKLNRIIKPS